MFALQILRIPLPGRHPPSPLLANGSAYTRLLLADFSPSSFMHVFLWFPHRDHSSNFWSWLILLHHLRLDWEKHSMHRCFWRCTQSASPVCDVSLSCARLERRKIIKKKKRWCHDSQVYICTFMTWHDMTYICTETQVVLSSHFELLYFCWKPYLIIWWANPMFSAV